MTKTLPFDEHVAEYEEWFDKYNNVFLSEVAAIRELIPEGENLFGLEVGTGTGLFQRHWELKKVLFPLLLCAKEQWEKV